MLFLIKILVSLGMGSTKHKAIQWRPKQSNYWHLWRIVGTCLM